MRRLSRRYLLELCLSDCYLLVLIFRFVSAQFFQMRLQYFCIQYCDTKYFCGPNFSKSWTFHAFRFGLEMSHHIVSAKNFRLECFCFLLSCISKIIYPCSVITLPFNSDGLLCQNSLLVFSWMHQLFLFWNGGCVQNFPVCFIACRLGSFGTDLYHVRTRLLNMTWSNLRFNVWRSFVTMAINLPSCFSVEFLEHLLKFLANFTLLKYVKSQRSYGFLITKELIFGFEILDLKDHFSASLI